MMGRVKELLPEDWTGPDMGREPDELEILAWEAEQAQRRLEDARKKHAAKEGICHGPV